MPPEYRVLPAGDAALVIEFGDRVDRELSAFVLALAQRLDAAGIDGVIETTPTFRSLMVCYEPLAVSTAALVGRIADVMEAPPIAGAGGRGWRLPVCYDAGFAPDLAAVAARSGLSPAQAIERHSAEPYHVYMLGFLPGQAYMGDLPAELALPRRANPRPRIPAGSVAIATSLTCVFPFETPCGWHVIGRSPAALWDMRADRGALLTPGDRVTLTPISLREYERLLAQGGGAALAPAPLDGVVGEAA